MNTAARTNAFTLHSFQLLGSYGRKPIPASATKPLATSLRHVEGLKSAPRRASASEIIEIVPEWLSSHVSTVKRSAHPHISFVFTFAPRIHQHVPGGFFALVLASHLLRFSGLRNHREEG